jgi:ABC-type thiamin/hydroxymethylpyrimidine transport system permease subunit
MFFFGFAITITLPLLLKLYSGICPVIADNYVILLFTLFFSGIGAELIIFELRNIFKSVLKDNCFITSNVHSLSRMSYYSYFIAGFTLIRMFFYVTPSSIIIIIVFIIAGLFSKVLSCVFDKAVAYKLENDMTI